MVRLYVEGAPQKDDFRRARCREAFSAFFEAAGITRRPRTVPCGSREAAFTAFEIAVKTAKANELPLLLIDSEGAVAAGHTSWQHLKAGNGWDRPPGAGDDQAFLMVQVMETWFLADPATLRQYFGPHFSNPPFRAWPALEAVPKQTVYDALAKATAECKQVYRKGDVSFDLLASLTPATVEAACPHAKALLERLRSL